MGRTVPTYRLHTEAILNDWMDYRRALREKDREVFDELMYKARLHASAGSYTAQLDPVATMFLSILLEMQKEIRKTRGSKEEPGGEHAESVRPPGSEPDGNEGETAKSA